MVKKRYSKLFVVDPSLTSTGWVVFDLQRGGIIKFGVMSDPGAKIVLSERLKILQQEADSLLSSFKLGKNDVLICEGPAHLVLNPQSALKVEQMRGIFEVLARKRGVDVPGRVNPRSVQTEVLGLKGAQLERKEVKRAARNIAERLFAKDFAKSKKIIPQDVIDASLIGAYCIARIALCEQLGVDLAETFKEGGRSFARQRGGRRMSR